MKVSPQDVVAAKAFLADLPLGIATSTGVAAVRTVLADHDNLEMTLRTAEIALEGRAATESDGATGVAAALADRVRELSEALGLERSETAPLKERLAALELRLQESDGDRLRIEELSTLLEKERERAGVAENAASRTGEQRRENEQTIVQLSGRVAELTSRVDELSALLEKESARAGGAEHAASRAEELLRESEQKGVQLSAQVEDLSAKIESITGESQDRAKRAEAAEARVSILEAETAGLEKALVEARTQVEILTGEGQRQGKRTEAAEARVRALEGEAAGLEKAVAEVRNQAEAMKRAAAERESELAGEVAALTNALSDRDSTLAAQGSELKAERDRGLALVQARDAATAEAQSQRAQGKALEREVVERDRSLKALQQRVESTDRQLGMLRGRLDSLSRALVPFAEMAGCYDPADEGWVVESGWTEAGKHRLIVKDFRDARDAVTSFRGEVISTLAPDLVGDHPGVPGVGNSI